MRSFVSLLLALCALVLVGCQGLEARTQIMAILDADERVQHAASALHLQVYGRARSTSTWEKVAFDEISEPLPTFPFRMAVVPKQSGQRQFRVVAEAAGPGGYLVRAQVIGSFQAGKTLAVPLYLDDRCNRVACDEAEETCRAGICVSAVVAADELHAYDADDVHHVSGIEGDEDAGEAAADAGLDAGEPHDDGGMMSCIPDTQSCSDDTLTRCNAEGVASSETCTLGCSSSGKACNACAPGKNTCADSELTVCGEDGLVTRREDCPDGCHPEGDRCQIHDCEPSTTECISGQLVVCDAAGRVVSNDVCPFGCHAGAEACYQCEPSLSRCEGDALIVCDADGNVSSDKACTLGCSARRCLDIAPSNNLEDQVALLAPTDPELRLTGAATIDTDTGVVTNGDGTTITVPSDMLSFEGNAVRVFRVKAAHLETVRVLGKPAIVLVSDGPIVITGLFDVSADGTDAVSSYRGLNGPGSLPDGAPCTGRNSPYTGSGNNAGWGGGGGGGGATRGGKGGTGFVSGAEGGAAHGNAELVPLIGGCQGGHPTDVNGGGDLAGYGTAGGAMQLVSRTSIAIGGNLDAGGGGGGTSGFSAPYVFGGAGGGSGGGILLEAPSVELTGILASITANGGGGSAGGGTTSSGGTCTGTPGADARRDGTPAEGGRQCSPTAGAAGNGAAAVLAPGTGSNGNTQGGAGGGAVGRIRINTLSGFTVRNGAIVSPPASEGTLGTR